MDQPKQESPTTDPTIVPPAVTLVYFTGKDTQDPHWYAARLLAFTKNTRLNMTPDGFSKFMNQMTVQEIKKELEYMSATIPSSWEFVDVVFAVNNISRACAQQMTRSRIASFAMQAQRVTNVAEASCYIPDSIPENCRTLYQLALSDSMVSYEKLVKEGVALQDARGVLPMHVHCNLVAKYNFRAWIDLMRTRSSLRVQDEYREVVRQMQQEVKQIWPWAELFLMPKQAKAITLMEQLAEELNPEQRTRLAKAADQLKKETA